MLLGTPVSLYVEVPQQLHNHLQLFLDVNTNWDVDQVMTIALAQFLKSKEKEEAATSSIEPPPAYKTVTTSGRHHRCASFTESAEPKTAGLSKGGLINI